MEKKVRSHIGISRFLLESFSYDGKHVWVYNVNNKRMYMSSTKDVGVKKGYYSENVENKLSDYESRFGDFITEIKDIVKRLSIDEAIQYLVKNNDLVIEFANVALLRTDFLFEYFQNDIQKYLREKNISLSSTSDIMKFCLEKRINLIEIVGSKASLVISEAQNNLITNSLAFHISLDKNKNKRMFIPISKSIGIIVSKEFENYTIDDDYLNFLNRQTATFDKSFGYGFLVANDKNDINEVVLSALSLLEE